MDKDQIEGSAKNIKAKVKEGGGNVTGDAKRQGQGNVENTTNSLKDKAEELFKRNSLSSYPKVA